jgi:DNA-binding NtrC family response regulator
MKQILLSDDDEAIRTLYQQLLRDRFTDYGVEVLTDGDSLVGRLEKEVDNVAVVITDNSMPPGPAGSEVIKRYARGSKFGKIPFILVYAGDITLGNEAIQNGAFDFIEKPFNLQQFIGVVQKALDKYKE